MKVLKLDRVDEITLSIISHEHGLSVERLVEDALTQAGVGQVILTLNVDESLNLPVTERLQVIRNQEPKGFGVNHNAAFKFCNTPYFCVLNPDIDLSKGVFNALLECIQQTRAAVVAPLVLSPHGEIEDSWRRFPTFIRLACKALGHDTTLWPQKITQPRIDTSVLVRPEERNHQHRFVAANVHWPDWVGGMCMLFDSAAFQALKGFDERFFLYYEDVDICARIWQSGATAVGYAGATITHDARRASHRAWEHTRWHARSMALYFWKYAWRLPKTKRLC